MVRGISPHFSFPGTCEEAFRFYARLLNGRLETLITYGESPMRDQVPPDWHAKIVHATLEAAGVRIAGGDAVRDQYVRPQGVFLLLNLDDLEEGRRIAAALADGGEEQMPFAPTFWSPGFAVVVDRFGVIWEINCEDAGAAATTA